MAGAISVLRNPVIGRICFQCVSLDSHSSLDLDANGHQSSFSDFDLNPCSLRVKQVDDNYT